MELQRLRIQNYKSLVDLEIVNPNPFTVFVGPNGAGKSNIFEALEFLNYLFYFRREVWNIFGSKDIINVNSDNLSIRIDGAISNQVFTFEPEVNKELKQALPIKENAFFADPFYLNESERQLVVNFSRLFIRRESLEKINYVNEKKVSISARNLEQVLKRILKDDSVKEEFLEWLQLFIPEFENIEVHTDNISGADNFLIYEKHSKRPFTKALISDGTYNILALLTAVFQSDGPQFLCIEEPENGLNPYVVKELVNLFRNACEEKGHYIWLNTHSQTLVSALRPEELILVDKVGGATQIKQVKDKSFGSLTMDKAWLTNTLGGGLPW